MEIISYIYKHAGDIVGLVVLVLIAAGILKFRRVKGAIGEYRIRLKAKVALDPKIYFGFHDVMLRCLAGGTQIDHIFISRFGIFVVETKNMSGWLFGKEADAMWTQQIYSYKRKFQNPLRQNFKHVKAVEMALGVSPDHVHSVIAFMGKSTFETRMPANVTSGSEFATYIKSFQVPVFTQEQTRQYAETLEKKRLSSSHILSVTHVRNFRRKWDVRAIRRCPECGSRLVVRTAKKGANPGSQFWACSAYPNCKFTQNIT